MFDFNDAWLLCSIHSSEMPQLGAELENVIAYADYTNHAIMNYSEFTVSLNKLLNIKIVRLIDNNLFTTDSFKKWHNAKYNGKKRIYVLKEIENVVKYLNDSFVATNSINEINLIKITEQDFSTAVANYLNRFKKISSKA